MTPLALAVALDLVLVVTDVAAGGALAVHAVLAVLPEPAAPRTRTAAGLVLRLAR